MSSSTGPLDVHRLDVSDIRRLLDVAGAAYRRAKRQAVAAKSTAELPLVCAVTRARPITTTTQMARTAGLARSTIAARGGHREPVAGLDDGEALEDLYDSVTGRRLAAVQTRESVAEARARLAAVVAAARLFLTGDAIARRLAVSPATVSRLARAGDAPSVERGWHPHPGDEAFERWFDGRRFTRQRRRQNTTE